MSSVLNVSTGLLSMELQLGVNYLSWPQRQGAVSVQSLSQKIVFLKFSNWNSVSARNQEKKRQIMVLYKCLSCHFALLLEWLPCNLAMTKKKWEQKCNSTGILLLLFLCVFVFLFVSFRDVGRHFGPRLMVSPLPLISRAELAIMSLKESFIKQLINGLLWWGFFFPFLQFLDNYTIV